jgi:hypothetical protein
MSKDARYFAEAKRVVQSAQSKERNFGEIGSSIFEDFLVQYNTD